MAAFIELIAKIKQKNNGTFKLVDAQDIECEDGKGLDEALNEKLDKNLGAENTNKVLVTDAEGNVVTQDKEDFEGGGTTDYNGLTNKPSINGIELSGNKTSSDLKMYTQEEVNYLLDDKMDKPYYDITISDDTTIENTLAGNFKMDSIEGSIYQNTTLGNQLFNASLYDGILKGGVTVKVDNGVISLSGTSQTNIWIQTKSFTKDEMNALFKAGNLYVKNNKSSSCNYDFGIYINARTVREANSPFVVTQEYLEKYVSGCYFFIEVKANTNPQGTIQPMIYQNGEGTFEQFTGGISSPNPDYQQKIYEVDEINIKLINNNLFSGELEAGAYSIENGMKDNAPIERRYRCKDFIKLPSNKISYRMASTVFSSSSFWILYYDVDKKYLGTYNRFESIPDNAEYITFYCVGREAVSYVNTDKVMIIPYHSGSLDKITDYEEAKETSIQHTLSKPLRATKDGSVKDIIDIVNMQTIYKLKKDIFDGSEDEFWQLYSNTLNNTYGFRIKVNDMKNGSVGCSDKLVVISSGISSNDNEVIMFGTTTDNYIYIRINKNRMSSYSVNDLKTWLLQNAITTIYQLETPTTEPLDDELVQKLKTLKTFSPTTHVFVTGIAKPRLNAKYPKDIASAQAQLEQKVLLMSETLTETQAKLLLQGGN